MNYTDRRIAEITSEISEIEKKQQELFDRLGTMANLDPLSTTLYNRKSRLEAELNRLRKSQEKGEAKDISEPQKEEKFDRKVKKEPNYDLNMSDTRIFSQSLDAAEERINNMGKVKRTIAVVTGQFLKFSRLIEKARSGKVDMDLASVKIDRMFK